MSVVTISENDAFETALKDFNRKVQQDGVLSEARRRQRFVKPPIKRKQKTVARQHKTIRKRS